MKIKLGALLLGVVFTHTAIAQDADPPSLVGRVSYVQGNAGLQAGDATAEQVELNRPVTIGDRLRTEGQALIELSLGTSAVRIDENTDLTVANLDDDITQLQLDSGVVSLHVLELSRTDNIEIDTPTATVRLLEPGDYRIDAAGDGTTRVAVRHGSAELDGGGGPVRVRDQQQLIFAGADQPTNIASLTTPDDFDQWGMSRDRRFENSESAKYVSREVVGYEDLDANGSWSTDPDYGQVWYPARVEADWAPYRYGSWVWVQPWGWSWVDDSPWGFAPFHYGRWAYVRSRWGWVPGPRSVRPVYAPALVAWDGGARGGAGVSFTISNRPNRWIPLGPREVYVPAHQVSPRYLRNVNVSNTVIVNNVAITNAYQNRTRDVRYVNRAAPNAVSTRDVLPRVARAAPAPRPLPPRAAFARGGQSREGMPVVARPSQPFQPRRLENRPEIQQPVQQQEQQMQRQQQQRQELQQRAPLDRQPDNRRDFQVQQSQQREQQQAQFQQQQQLQRQEQIQRQQAQVAEQAQRQQQQRSEQAQREQQMRQQQDQMRAQQAQRQDQQRLQQLQRAPQAQQPAQRQPREQAAARPVDREPPRRGDRDDRQPQR